MSRLLLYEQKKNIYSYNPHIFTKDSSLYDVIRQNGKVLNRKHALVIDFCSAYLLLKNLDMHTKSRHPFVLLWPVELQYAFIIVFFSNDHVLSYSLNLFDQLSINN